MKKNSGGGGGGLNRDIDTIMWPIYAKWNKPAPSEFIFDSKKFGQQSDDQNQQTLY